MPEPGEEVRQLQGCVNDLISVLALSAIWTGRESSHVIETLVDALLGMLRLDFVYVRVSDSVGDPPLEAARTAPRRAMATGAAEIRVALADVWGAAPAPSTARLSNPVGDGEVSVARVRLGVDDEEGVLVAASQREDFPTRTEMLLLQVAANQATLGSGKPGSSTSRSGSGGGRRRIGGPSGPSSSTARTSSAWRPPRVRCCS